MVRVASGDYFGGWRAGLRQELAVTGGGRGDAPATRPLIEACMRETEAVARAAGISLRQDVVERIWDFIHALGPAGTSSLQPRARGEIAF